MPDIIERNATCARQLLEAGAEIARLTAENAKMWTDFDVLKATVLANERAKDAEIEALRAALQMIVGMCLAPDQKGHGIGKMHAIACRALEHPDWNSYELGADEQREDTK